MHSTSSYCIKLFVRTTDRLVHYYVFFVLILSTYSRVLYLVGVRHDGEAITVINHHDM